MAGGPRQLAANPHGGKTSSSSRARDTTLPSFMRPASPSHIQGGGGSELTVHSTLMGLGLQQVGNR